MARTLLLICGLLALALFALGFAPWSRPGPPLRPAVAPAAAARHFDTTLLETGREYRSEGYRLYFLRKGLVGLLLVLALAGGAHLRLRAVAFGPPVVGATLALLVVFVVLEVVRWPFAWHGLQVARAAGISTITTPLWIADQLKGLGLFLVQAALVGVVLLALLQRFPRGWWMPATLGVAVGGALLTFLLPVVIDPIFNRFEPLADAALRERYLAITREAGVPVREVLVADASRRTTAVNAYFTGFGPTRRIVVYDTLVRSLTPREGELVIAHEAGHWRHHDIYHGLLMGTAGAGLALFLAALLLGGLFRARAFGLTGPVDPAAAVLFLLLYWLGTFLALPIENAISRRIEARADAFALDLTGDAATQIQVEVALGRRNLSDIVPPPLARLLFFSHPGTLERIAQAEAFAERRGTGPLLDAPLPGEPSPDSPLPDTPSPR